MPIRLQAVRLTVDGPDHPAREEPDTTRRAVARAQDVKKPAAGDTSQRAFSLSVERTFPPRNAFVQQALEKIAAEDGAGVAVFISDTNPAWLSERYGADPEVDHGANVLRDYGVGAQILIDLGVRDMVLLTNSTTVLPGSAGYGLRILERRPLD